MTGFAPIPLTEEGDASNEAQWAGTARILGPRWSHLPTITLCFLGVQLFWSIEMSYGEQYQADHIV
jgi:solute carrier family 45, member 1/2/4